MQTPANTQLFHEGRAENIISSCFAKRALESVTQIAKRPLERRVLYSRFSHDVIKFKLRNYRFF